MIRVKINKNDEVFEILGLNKEEYKDLDNNGILVVDNIKTNKVAVMKFDGNSDEFVAYLEKSGANVKH